MKSDKPVNPSILHALREIKTEDIEMFFCEMPPALADKLLSEFNSNNRRIKPGVVRRYTADIRSGKWRKNPQAIFLHAETLNLLDGQHRLSAIVESGITVTVAVGIVDMEFELAQCTMDNGVRRNPHDVFTQAGYTVPRITTGVASFLAKIYDNGEWRRRHASGRLNNETMLEFYDEYSDAIDYAVSHVTGTKDKGIIVLSVLSAVAIAYGNIPGELLDRIVAALVSGVTPDERLFPAVRLRQFLVSNLRNAGGTQQVERLLKSIWIIQKIANNERPTSVHAASTVPWKLIRNGEPLL